MPCGAAPDVEDAGRRCRVRDDDPRLEVLRRQHDAHAVHVREVAQRLAFVRNAVLQAHDRRVVGHHGLERVQHTERVLALDAEQDDVAVAELDLHGRSVHLERERDRLLGCHQAQAVGADGVVVRPAGDQHHLVIVLVQPRPDDAPDCPCTDHHEPHRRTLAHGAQRGHSAERAHSSHAGTGHDLVEARHRAADPPRRARDVRRDGRGARRRRVLGWRIERLGRLRVEVVGDLRHVGLVGVERHDRHDQRFFLGDDDGGLRPHTGDDRGAVLPRRPGDPPRRHGGQGRPATAPRAHRRRRDEVHDRAGPHGRDLARGRRGQLLGLRLGRFDHHVPPRRPERGRRRQGGVPDHLPGLVPRAAVHIHVKVHDGGTVHTTQLFFDQGLTDQVFAKSPYQGHSGGTTNAQDGIYSGGGSTTTLKMTPSSDGYTGAITLGLRR